MPDPAFLGQAALARRWGLSQRTLERWRCFGEGPSFLKLGGRVLYRLSARQRGDGHEPRAPDRVQQSR